jgi:hypothetical protein
MPLFSFYIAAMRADVAAYLIACDRWDDAREHARKALDLAQETQYDVCRASTIQHLAAIAALAPCDDEARSETSACGARLLGYVDALIATLDAARQDTERQEYDRVLTALDQTLGAARRASFMAEGAALKSERATELARSISTENARRGIDISRYIE